MKTFLKLFVLVMVGVFTTQCANQVRSSRAPVSSLQSIYFDYDKALINHGEVAKLQGNASYLKKNSSVNVVIEGHCDPRGTNEYNLALGQRRALAAADYLANLGVNPSRMKTVSYGEERLVCSDSSESCWQRNRRADFRK